MYKVELYHFGPSYRRGDLEEDETLVSTSEFKLKKEVKDYVHRQVKNKKFIEIWNTGSNPSYVYYYTDKTWTNENSGETRRERYSYKITKVRLK